MKEQEIEAVVDRVLREKLHEETVDDIRGRLEMVLEQETNFDQVYGRALSGTRTEKLMEEIRTALREELCVAGKLKEEYEEFLTTGNTANSLQALTTSVLVMVNPALAVPSVGILVALWVLRVGLKQWCKNAVSSEL